MNYIQGKLEEQSNGKFELIKSNGKGLGYDFSCGSGIEVWDENQKIWEPGRVEGRQVNGTNVYYFYNKRMEYPALYNGMVVRILQE